MLNATTAPYRNWAFRLLIYLILLNAASFYLTAHFAQGFHKAESLQSGLALIGVFSIILLVVGILFTILSFVKKERRNYQIFAAVAGYTFFIVWLIAQLVM